MTKPALVFGLGFIATFLGQGAAFGGELQDQVNQEISSRHLLSANELQIIQDTQFIFIDGTFGDFYRANFEPAQAVLENDWKAEHEVYFPTTTISVPENSEIDLKQIEQFRAQSTKKKAIVIAHSKGATEVLLLALHHPDLIRQMNIASIVLVSAPVAGTRIVEFVHTYCSTHTDALCSALSDGFPSLETFLPEVIQPIFKDALAQVSANDRAELESKIFYVHTQMPDFDLKSRLYIPNLWMRVSHPEDGPNDGAIPTKNMVLYEHGFDAGSGGAIFGTDLGIMMGDHNSLMNRAKTPKEEVFREAFFRVLAERVLLGSSE